jgi:hypothetical protein
MGKSLSQYAAGQVVRFRDMAGGLYTMTIHHVYPESGYTNGSEYGSRRALTYHDDHAHKIELIADVGETRVSPQDVAKMTPGFSPRRTEIVKSFTILHPDAINVRWDDEVGLIYGVSPLRVNLMVVGTTDPTGVVMVATASNHRSTDIHLGEGGGRYAYRADLKLTTDQLADCITRLESLLGDPG